MRPHPNCNHIDALGRQRPTAYYLEDEVRMIIQALSFDKDDDPENRDGKKFEIDFAEKWYGWLNKRITKF